VAIGENTKDIASLQQIIMPKHLVDDVVMLARPGYNIPVNNEIDSASWNEAKKRHTKISPILDLYATNPRVIKDEWQARI